MMSLFDSLRSVEGSLAYHAERQNVIGSNLANLNTPGFVAQELVAEPSASRGLELTASHASHLGGMAGTTHADRIDDRTNAPGPDGNNVSLEREMAKMMANSLRYDAGAEIASRRLALLRYAASDGQG